MQTDHPLQTGQIAAFALKTSYSDLPPEIVDQLLRHLLDSLGSFIHSLKCPTIHKLIRHLKALDNSISHQPPFLGAASLDRVAQLYTALIRYPDFMDNFIGKEATCHPSDNIGALLAATLSVQIDSKEFIAAMAVGYAIECRLVEEIPVMMKGFDHTVLLGYSLTAAVSKLLGLNVNETSHALAMAGCSLNPLVTSRASYTYEWKGLASSYVAQNCIHFALLAKEGMTGPVALFEGPKGFDEVYGMKLNYDWNKEDLSLIRKCALKSYNSEVHTQSALEALEEIRREYVFNTADITEIGISTFLTCYHIVGGGAYGPRDSVHSKEQADHSLAYVASVLLLDGQVYPEQFSKDRILRTDVQELLRKVNVHTGSPLHKPLVLAGLLDGHTRAYPEKLQTIVMLSFNNGSKIVRQKDDYHGYYTRPFGWEETEIKFRKLTADMISEEKQSKIIAICQNLVNEKMQSLTGLLNSIFISASESAPFLQEDKEKLYNEEP